LPFVGSVRTLYLIAAVLFAIAITLAGLAFTRHNLAIITVFILGIAGSEGTNYLMFRFNRLHDIDTEYSRIRVFDTTDPDSGRPMRAMATDPASIQSARYLDGDDLALAYTRFYHLVKAYKPGHRNALMIGGAGYSFPQSHLRNYPEAKIDVVEIDPEMTQISRRFFGLGEDPRLRIFHTDGRMFLKDGNSGSNDVIFMDAFGSLFTVPYHLTTIEAVRDIHRMLQDDGLVIFNVGSAVSGPASNFLRAEVATYRAVFNELHIYQVHSDYAPDRLQNFMIVGCKTRCVIQIPLDADSTIDGTTVNNLLANRYTDDILVDLPILTDDLAPVERYSSLAQGY
jgi:Spermidine synthase